MSKDSTANYGNFRDPGGLVIRMLKRASYDAIWPLVQATATAVAKPFDHLASRWENLDAAENEIDSIPQILVLGLPRSGTTFASQFLAQQFDVSYFPNVSAIFPNATIWSSQKWLGDFASGPPSTKSFFGNTTGLRGINDGFHVWNRWFGHNRYRIDHTLTDDEARDLTQFFSAWNGTFRKPLLNKNNRNIDGIDVLSSLLPNARFVVIERDPVMMVQSLLGARRFIQGSSDAGWGLFSDHQESSGDAIDHTCRQVTIGLQRTEEQLRDLPADRYLRLRYEEMCARPTEAMQKVIDTVPGLRPRISAAETKLRPFTASTTIKLSTPELAQVRKHVGHFRRK